MAKRPSRFISFSLGLIVRSFWSFSVNLKNNITDSLDKAVFNYNSVKTYSNADIEKKSIYEDNKKKCGVYCRTNLSNGRRYVGSSINLSKRLSWYYSLESLNNNKNFSLISKAILKYGHSGFKLEILEYCEPNQPKKVL